MDYPVLEIVPSLKELFATNNTLILQAPPGAGKSTILPLQLLQESWLKDKKIVMLEPRRLAARSVAMRMADLLNEEVGQTVGYRVRFENKVRASTRIEVVTEGILTRKVQSDNALEDVGLIIFDEFHERSLQADLALALCRQVQSLLRADLRILIMSATLEGEKISECLNNAPILTSLGRQFPNTYLYISPEANTSLAIATTRVIRRALKEQSGDVLVFLPGAGEIQRVASSLESESISATVVPLYGDLPFRRQQEAILPHPQGIRKIVLATSIAETSLTIEGITTVIDSGYARVPRFDPRSGLTRLETVRVTKAAADQRAGRAARLGPGVTYRMWAESQQHTLAANRQPEITEADLSSLVLELANWGVQNINELTWIDTPPEGAILQARELLHNLDALAENKITIRGKEMLQLPTHPRLAHMLLFSSGEEELATDIAAVLEEQDPVSKEAGTDLSLRVEVLRKWRKGERVSADRNILERIERLAASWRRIFKREADNTIPVDTEIGKLVSEAYPERIARQQAKQSIRYKLANGRVACLPDHDPLMRESWISIAQLDAGRGEGKIFLAAPLRESDLMHRAKEAEIIAWDSDLGMITATRQKRIGNTVLSSKPIAEIESEIRIKILCEGVRTEGLKILNWTEADYEWQARVLNARMWRPDEDWPDVSDQHLLASTEIWLAPYLDKVSKRIDFARLDLKNILAGLLPWQLSTRLDQLAPARLQVPSGSLIKLKYSADGQPPVMEVRLQEMFGLLETPTVNEGRTKILLHLLSPGYKPVQVTQDLKSFWKTTYHEVRKELRMRYPRHHWPEDPWTAEAVRGVKRR